MERLRRSLFCLLAFAAGLAAGAGAETPIGGRVTGPDGRGLAGVRVALEPVRPDFERLETRLHGDAGPGPEAEATTDADGYFQLLAPRLGAWKVVAPWGSTGYLTEEILLDPLTEPTELPAVALRPAAVLEIRVLDDEGAPVEARLGLSDGGRPPGGWGPRLRLARAGDDGVARLPAGAGEEPRLEVLGPSHPLIVAGGDDLEPHDGRVEIRLPRGVAGTVTVTDPRGRRVAGAVAYQGAGILPLARTDAEGRLRLTVAPPAAEPPGVNFLTADGYRGFFEPRFAPGEPNAAEVVLEPLRAVRGRVVDRESRDPVAAALVWVPGGPITESDARGNYELRLFPSRRLTVQAAAEGYATAFESKTLAGLESEDGPTLALEPAGAVSGLVVDADGRPVAGVAVTAETLAMALRSSRSRRGDPGTRSTRDGRFFLSGLTPDASYTLHFRKPGFAPARHPVEALQAFENRAGVRIVLESGATGVGRVVDESEAPVAGAEVRLVPVVTGDMQRMPFRARLRAAGSGGDEPPPSSSDSEGRFRLAHLAPGRYDLEVRAGGFAPATVPGLAIPAEAGEIELGTVVLAAGVRLEGVVRDPQGAAVEDAEVFLRGRDAAYFRGGEEEPAAKSDAAGRFAVADLEPGKSYTLIVAKAGYGTASANAAAGEGAPVAVVLRPSGTISGRVRGEDGDPVAEATVFFHPASAMSQLAPRAAQRHAFTDEQGTFRIADVDPGDVELFVSATGFQEYQRRGLNVPAGGEVRDLEIVLVRGAAVVGTVTRRDGSPVVEARVSCLPAQEGSLYGSGATMSAQTDGEGRYRIDGAALGPAVISVRLGHLPEASKSVEIRSGTQTVDLVVDDGFEISGRVVDSAGLPVAGAALVLVITDADKTSFSTHTDKAVATGPDGAFTLEDVAAGHYLLTAAKDGYAAASTPEPFEVAGASVAGLELELRRGATLRGRVLGLELDELAGVVVRAFGSTGMSGWRQGIVDFEGSYSVPNLGPGDWGISAQIDGTGRQTAGRITVEEGDVDVELDLEFKTGFGVDGVVTSAGRPQSGIWVYASGMEAEARGQAHGMTDSEGRFRLLHLPAGKYQLTVTAGTSTHSQTFEVPADAEILVELAELRLSGYVRGEDGESPMAGAVVRLERVAADPDLDLMRNVETFSIETDSRGYFSLDAREGLWRLVATRAGYAPAEVTLDVHPGSRYDALELRLSPTEGVTFEVLAESGAALSLVVVAVLDASGRALTRAAARVGEGGTVRLSTVPPGAWDLVVQAGDSAAVRTPIVAPGHVGRIVLPRGGVLRIQVAALAGQQTLCLVALTGPDGRVHAMLEGGFGDGRQWPMWNGEATIPQLSPGVWSFTITHPDGRTWAGQALVTAGEASAAMVP